jgi:hypothetical protein
MFFLDIYNKNDDTNCGYLPNLSFGPTGWYKDVVITPS